MVLITLASYLCSLIFLFLFNSLIIDHPPTASRCKQKRAVSDICLSWKRNEIQHSALSVDSTVHPCSGPPSNGLLLLAMHFSCWSRALTPLSKSAVKCCACDLNVALGFAEVLEGTGKARYSSTNPAASHHQLDFLTHIPLPKPVSCLGDSDFLLNLGRVTAGGGWPVQDLRSGLSD